MQQGSWTPRLRRRSQRRGIRRHGSLTPIPRKMVWHLREKWRIPTVKLNGKERSPAQWEDGSYSVEGAAAHLGVDLSTIYTWLKTGRLTGEQLAKGMPWKVYLTEDDVTRLQEWLRRTRRSKKEAV